MKIRITRLAMLVDRLSPRIPEPRVDLEQYTTPGDLAARTAMLLAVKLGESFENSVVADLGAGTCRLSLAAALIGAGRVVAVEVDDRLAPLCVDAFNSGGVWHSSQVIISRVKADSGPISYADAVVMNPPFGVHRRGADREFLLYAMSLGVPLIVAILKHGNLHYFRKLGREYGYTVDSAFEYMFPLPMSMMHHRSRIRRIRVEVLVFERASKTSASR